MQDAKQTTRRRRKGEVSPSHSHLRATALAVSLVSCLSWTAVTRGESSDAPGRSSSSSRLDTGETVVRIYPSAVVTQEVITLADVAALEGPAETLADQWPIARAPRPGQALDLQLDQIQESLGHQGANLAFWVFRGSTYCRVNRPAGTVDAQGHDSAVTIRTGARSPVDAKRDLSDITASDAGSRSDSSPDRPDPNTLGGAVYDFLTERLSSLGGSPVIEFTPQLSRRVGLSQPRYQFQLTTESDRLLGLVPLSITVFEDGREQQVLRALLKVSLRKPVVVAANAINRGATLEADDVRLEERVYESIRDIGLTDAAPLIGQRARQFIRPGEQISPRDIEPVPLVRRNDLVTITLRQGGLLIRGSATALSSGGYGDVIELKSALARRSGESFAAVVTGHRTAEVRPAGWSMDMPLPEAAGLPPDRSRNVPSQGGTMSLPGTPSRGNAVDSGGES
jgi:flagella basal body P-ring formation protein FlgA